MKSRFNPFLKPNSTKQWGQKLFAQGNNGSLWWGSNLRLRITKYQICNPLWHTSPLCVCFGWLNTTFQKLTSIHWRKLQQVSFKANH